MFSDWFTYFWPQLSDPLVIKAGIFNLPWFYVFLQPLRLLGVYGSLIVIELLTLWTVFRLARKLQLSRLRTFFVLFSAPVVWCLFMGQVDGLILIAYLASTGWAMFLGLCKPQVSIGAGVNALRRNPQILIWALFLFISAWMIWGWPFKVQNPPTLFSLTFLDLTSWNWSFWPLGLLLIPLLFSRDWRAGMLVSPFLFPYAGLQSLIGPVLVLAKLPWKYFIPIWVLLWVRWGFMIHPFR